MFLQSVKSFVNQDFVHFRKFLAVGTLQFLECLQIIAALISCHLLLMGHF